MARVRVRYGPGDEVAELAPVGGGWWRLDVPDAGPGTDYAFLLDDSDDPLPDPRARWLPHGVHGASRVYDHAVFAWTDHGWTGRQLPGAVLYELHIGTFTPDGTFDAAIERLDHLVDLGVDLVEVLPVNGFNGVHNWGYDGVAWYAVHEPYGGPDGLKRFVDACHARGLGVVLDVVHNHLGPSGNYLPRFGPYLKAGRNTWGDLLNLDGPDSDPVRRHILDNVAMWLRDYHVDALRLDAVHALADTRATHLLEEMARETEALSTHLGRPLSLIAESDLNDPRLVTAREAGGYGLHAAWDDDVHHALHAALTGERHGYYNDFGSLATLATALEGAYVHAGTWSSFRGRVHGRPVDRVNVAGHRFVVFLQNHDQIGNRAVGDRITATLGPDLLKVGALLLLTSPFTPMLFMGEEWGARTPWQFFTSHPEPELAAVTGRGRMEEFAAHGWAEVDVPHPQDPETFTRSKLDWSELDRGPHADLLAFHRRLLALRKAVPDLSDPRLDRVRVRYDEDARWLVVGRQRHAVVANLADVPRTVPLDAAADAVLLATDERVSLSPDAVELPPRSAAVVRVKRPSNRALPD
ncbi:MAG TPA: malto-oligosyltrehalose trehalohydrolase [Cryptosporangiaceae bacterium]|nr:malto-oligosyltrehalose trehalohydrolase [Cryptosporangiaceae bacterium]